MVPYRLSAFLTRLGGQPSNDAVISGLTTTDGGVDWVGVVTIAAGLVLVITGVFNSLHHGTA